MTYKTNGFKFRMCTDSMKAARIMSDKFAQFYGDSRITFLCFYERHEDEIEFFGYYTTDDEDLMVQDCRIINSIGECYRLVFDEDEEVELDLDPRIREMKYEKFDYMFNPENFYSQEDSDEYIKGFKSNGGELQKLIDFADLAEEDEEGENEEADEDEEEYTSVVYNPEFLKKVDGEIQQGINDTLFGTLEGGQSAYVTDEEEIDSFFAHLCNALLEQDMRRY